MFVLTERCIEVFAGIGEYGLLDTDMVHDLYFPGVSRRRCQQKLQQWADAGYIHTTKLVVSEVADRTSGSRTTTKRIPAIHCVTERAADVVETAIGIRPKRVMRSEPRPDTFHHRRELVAFRLAFDACCHEAGLELRPWVLESDVRADAARELPPNQRSMLYHRFSENGQPFSLRLDAATCLRLPAGSGGGDAADLLVGIEIDRSTEGGKQLRGTGVSSKGKGYRDWLESAAYQRYWPTPLLLNHAVRIFWVVPSEQRITTIATAVADHPIAQNFRYLVKTDIGRRQLVTEPVWRTADGQRKTIYVPT